MGSCEPAPGRRLYLRRNSQFRPIRNAGEVEALLSELGFQVVEPEKLSFAEQVKLFKRDRSHRSPSRRGPWQYHLRSAGLPCRHPVGMVTI